MEGWGVTGATRGCPGRAAAGRRPGAPWAATPRAGRRMAAGTQMREATASRGTAAGTRRREATASRGTAALRG
uniref:Uncharacterized protein n=1 Tax=Arundo donax TaxID=35708 RepID=A0A0A9FPL1_ARUDO